MNSEIIKIVLAFSVLINPFGVLSVFLDLTRGYSTINRRKFAQVACFTVFITITFFTLAGSSILKVLGISLGSFQVAGGILIFLIAINMMNGDGNPAKPDEENVNIDQVQEVVSSHASAVVPVAIPFLVGPGGISTIVIYSSKANGMVELTSIIVAGFFVSLFCYVVLMAAGRLAHLLGDTGLNIFSRIMGMLLAAVAIEIMVSGLKSIFPQLV